MEKKVYVAMTDKALSGWGMARGKINKLIFECDSMEQAEIVEKNAKNRSDMIYVGIHLQKPRYTGSKYYVQEKTIEDYPSWYERNAF